MATGVATKLRRGRKNLRSDRLPTWVKRHRSGDAEFGAALPSLAAGYFSLGQVVPLPLLFLKSYLRRFLALLKEQPGLFLCNAGTWLGSAGQLHRQPASS